MLDPLVGGSAAAGMMGMSRAARETVWFSPHCINQTDDEQPSLFSNGSNK